MSFPLAPSNNQTAVLNGLTYIYNSSNLSWTRVTQFITGTTSLVISGTTPTTSTTTGALVVAGGVGIGGNLNIGGSFISTGTGGSLTGAALISSALMTVTSTASSTSTTTGALVVSGGVGVSGNINFGGSLYQNGVLFTGGGFSSPQTIGLQTGTTYTLLLADAGKLLEISNAIGTTVTIPPESSVNFTIGQRIDVSQNGTGPVTIVAGSGVILHTTDAPVLNSQYAIGTLIKIASNEWTFAGPSSGAVGYTGSIGYTGSQGVTGFIGSAGNFATVQTLNVQTSTAYTLLLSDAGTLVEINNSLGSILTIPPESSVNFTIGQRIDISQNGSGPVTISPGLGVVLHTTDTPILNNQYSIGTLIKIASNEWTFAGPSTSVGGGGYINLTMPGTITPPFTGVARFYPPMAMTINTVYANLGATPSGSLNILIKKNGTFIGTTCTLSSALMTPVTVSIPLATTDYLTMDVSGSSANDLLVKLKYI